MSLIQDALKASQREKDRRTSAAHPSVPLIVPLRSKPKEEFNWKNALTIGVSLAVIAGSGYVLYYRMFRPADRPLVASAPAPYAAAPTDTATVVRAAGAPVFPSASIPEPRADRAGVVAETPPRSTQVARTPSRGLRVAPQTRAAAPVSAPVSAPSARPADAAPSGGRLNVAVEQPRGYEVARLFAAAVAAHRAGDLDGARTGYERVLQLSPNDVDALNNLGVLLAAQREVERAEQVLRRAVRLAPRNASAWSNLGTVLAQRGHSGEAIAAYSEALSVDPLNTATRVSLAQQHLAIGASGRARELLEEALVGSPTLPEAHYTLGQAFEAQKDWTGAIRAYSNFIRLAPARLSADVERVRERVQVLSARVK